MNDQATEFLAKLLDTYKLECEEHLQVLFQGLLEIESNPSEERQKELLETIFREAHSLKVASRAVNFSTVEQLCQNMEGVLSSWKNGLLTPSPAVFNALYAIFDWLIAFIKQEHLVDSSDIDTTTVLMQNLKEAYTTTPPDSSKTTLTDVSEKDTALLRESSVSESSVPPPKTTKKESVDSTIQSTTPGTIRVSADKLDLILQEVEELLLIKFIASQHLQNFKEITQIIAELEKQWQNVPQISKKSDLWINYCAWQDNFILFVKSKLNQYTQTALADYRSVTHLIEELLIDTKQLLMQPFSILLRVFPRMVRDLAQSLNKEVKLQTIGVEIEIDRRILEELKDPLTHLIRNSIDHGIEYANIRLQKNKPAHGTIIISAAQISGNSVEIIISDDGQGIDIDKVKQSALKNGKINLAQSQTMSNDQALSLIFQSGLSTSNEVTTISGRGLGMGIVLEKIEKFGGKLVIDNKPGHGIAFRILLPLTLATFRGIHIITNQQNFVISTQSVKRVFRASRTTIQSVHNHYAIVEEGRVIPYFHLNEILGIQKTVEMKPNDMQIVLLIKAQDSLIAVGVDEIVGEQEILVKGLGRQLLNISHILAVTIFESGNIVPILDANALVKTANDFFNKSTVEEEMSKCNQKKDHVILMAEDSLTMRILLQNILTSAGYQLRVAVDGIEALAVLETEHVDLLLSDVEMPLMNGFELTEKVRQIARFKNLPIVICTSRGSTKDREHGMQLGANAYIDKNKFVAEELLNVIEELLGKHE